MDKRGVLGLDIAKAVIMLFLIIAIIGVTLIIVLASISNSNVADSDESGSFRNQTTLAMNTTGWQITGTTNYDDCVVSLTNINNASTGEDIATGNYTTSACFINASTATAPYLNGVWNLTGTYTYTIDKSKDIKNNITTGVTLLFSNTGTIFTILGVVVIISAIAIILVVVSKFGAGTRSTGL